MDQYRSLASILCFTGLFMLFSLETQAGTCSATSTSSCGSIIIDNTPNAGKGISTNLRTIFGDKPSTAIETGTGGNAINIDAPQVMQRVNGIDLTDAIGVENTTSVSDSNFGTSSQLTQFSDVSGHLFDLYDNRQDLGNTGKPDGERFKGRGFIQLTGRHNYEKIGRKIGLGNKLIEDPDLANDSEIAARILAAFLKEKKLQIKKELFEGDLRAARKLVNGGSHGIERFSEAYNIGQKEIPDLA